MSAGKVQGLQDPEHGGELRREVPHQIGGPRPNTRQVLQVNTAMLAYVLSNDYGFWMLLTISFKILSKISYMYIHNGIIH